MNRHRLRNEYKSEIKEAIKSRELDSITEKDAESYTNEKLVETKNI